MSKQVLIVWGGWDGHTPHECADLWADELGQAGYRVTVRDTLEAYLDADLMGSLDLIVPIWTMGQISGEQWNALDQTIFRGCGIAGFHGGMIDAFRMNTDYQWMTGAQWVAHPGNGIPSYAVHITDPDHAITRGLSDFKMTDTEQYYCHHDPANHVLCTTTFTGKHGDPRKYAPGATLPYAWTKTWGDGKVFCAAWGHTFKDFDVPQAKEIVKRGMLWATR